MSLKTPENKYRALPFWSFNGKLKVSELIRQTKILNEMGFGGAFMHSRCGLSTEYMSNEWLTCVGETADELFSRGMQGWLYDEDRWPSGSCGGKATQKKENRQKALSMYIENIDCCNYDRVLATFALKLDGDADLGSKWLGKRLIDYKRLSKDEELQKGYVKAFFVVEFIEPSDFYNGNTYLDTLNKNAVNDFILLTHEKYKKFFGEKFGKQVKGIFVDEPHRGGVFNGFNVTNKNAQAMLPWSYETFDLYAKTFNERVEERLPELFFSTNEEFNRTVWQYLETLQTQFLQAFAIPYYEWCKNNNLKVTGHVWDENTLLGQINWQGSVMRYYEYMDVPGIDNIRDDNYYFVAPLQAVSIAKQTGKKEVLSEMYGCTGWKTTFDYYKRSGDWQAILGINVRCPHLSWYTMGGEAKRDCPASIFFQAGWYKEYKYVEDYFARLKMTFSNAEYLTSVLMISPIESAMGKVRAGKYSGDVSFNKLETDWRRIVDDALFAGVDFDIADEHVLSNKGYVKVENGQAWLTVGKMRYKSVVLPPLINVRLSTLRLLQAFVSHGGVVYVADELPRYCNGVKRNVDIKAKVVSLSQIADTVKKEQDDFYQIAYNGKMLSKIKKAKKGYLLYLVAFDCAKQEKAEITILGEHYVSVINLRNGEIDDCAYTVKDGKTVIEKSFVKGEELLLSIDDKKVEHSIRYARNQVELLQTEFDYILSEPNVLPLDYAEFEIDGKKIGYDEFLKIDKCVREKFGLKERSANNLQPWYEEKYNYDTYHKKLCRVKLVYHVTAKFKLKDAYLMKEELPNEVWKLNGKVLKNSVKEPFISDICFSRVDLSELEVGDNVIEVEFDFTPACNIETAYLVGNFAVDEKSLNVYELPKKLSFIDLSKQGFPFYTGAVTYNVALPNGKYDIEMQEFGATCIKANGVVSAFAPFVLKDVTVRNGTLPLTAVLLRRNLFGPLHEIPKNHGNYWSGSYRTENEKFVNEYQLNEQGVLRAPKIFYKETLK